MRVKSKSERGLSTVEVEIKDNFRPNAVQLDLLDVLYHEEFPLEKLRVLFQFGV